MRPGEAEFFAGSPPHSGAMGQEAGKKWAAAAHSQPTIPKPDRLLAFRAAHGLGDAPLLLSVGRLTARKGLREFVTEVLPRIVAKRADARLLVIGDAPANALFGQAQTPASIQAAAATAGVAQHVLFLGKVSEEELATAYQAAQVHVFPIRALPNDPEGFGMVAIEAAAHGLPTVAYATGGVPDAVAHGQSGYLVPPGDAAAFADAVLRLLNMPLDEAGIRAFAGGFAWEVFGEKVGQVLQTTPLPVGGDR